MQGAKLRKVAERLLLARLRQHALDTVQKEEDSSRADRNNPADVKQVTCMPKIEGLMCESVKVQMLPTIGCKLTCNHTYCPHT